MENRRQFTRILFSIQATLTIEGRSYNVSLYDISLNGALITVKESVRELKTKTGTLNFSLSDNKSQVMMDITVVHENKEEIGLRCNAIDIDSVTHLRRLVELNLADNTQLNKELSQLTRSPIN